jgi:cell division protein FtsW
MPGEFAKIAIIFFIAGFVAKDHTRIYSILRGILPIVFVTGVYAGLIIVQPNLSTAITVAGISLGMMVLAGLKWRYVIIALLGLGGATGGLILFGYEHWRDRILSFTDPFANALGEGFQVAQSLLALGTGGLFGLGLGKSVQKNLYLPEPMNDFILSIIGEELGLIGVLVLMVFFMLLVWRIFRAAIHAPDRYGLMLAGGVGIMIALQVVLNTAVVTSSMPPTGIALPFISYGGNALWICMGSIGVVLNVSKQAVYPEDIEEEDNDTIQEHMEKRMNKRYTKA